MGQEGSEASGLQYAVPGTDIAMGSDILGPLTETKDAKNKAREQAARMVGFAESFHTKRAQYLANEFNKGMKLDPMQIDYFRTIQRERIENENWLNDPKKSRDTRTANKAKGRYNITQKLSSVRGRVIQECCTLGTESDAIFSRLPVLREAVEAARKNLADEKSELNELKAKYRRMKRERFDRESGRSVPGGEITQIPVLDALK